jgi:hypothetical protein
MSDSKRSNASGKGELDEEQLADVSGGIGAEADLDLGAEGGISPRDSASGLPTGKRQHKPFVFTKVIDKSTP